uniref:LRRNT domain-containing protein n=1 Tax=Branchiostoma floridae TaxID=7739 RepID=C3XV27_BRAFL|eukprot:XP_002611944.1 hypothetical protein BRAFLDRAFT_91828 [Branchiostoma floridae]
MGRKLRHLLTFLLIILKEPYMPEADCRSICKSSLSSCTCYMMGLTNIPQDLPVSLSILELSYNNITSLSQSGLKEYSKLRTLGLSSNHMTNIKTVAGIVLICAIIIWFKKKTPSDQHPQIDRSQLSMAQLAALKSNPLYGDVQTPKNRLQPSDGADSVRSLEHPNCALAEALSNTQNTATVTAVTNEYDSHHYEDIDTQIDQTRHGQSQAIIESNKHNAASVYEPKNENGQKGLDPSQATSQSLPPGVTNLQRNALLAALQPNPMYFDVKTATKKPSSTNMSSGHSQIGQGQSQAFTESNTNTTAAVVTSGHDNEYEDVDKLHDQTGQGQSWAITESNTHPTDAVVTSGHDQTGQGKSRAFTESNTHTTATAVTSSNDQTGQGQCKVPTDELLGDKNLTYNTEPATMEPNPMYANDQTGKSQPQASTDESLGDRNLLYTTEPATLEPNSLYSNDNTGQGQSEATAEKSRDTRNVIYSTESPASPYTYLQK